MNAANVDPPSGPAPLFAAAPSAENAAAPCMPVRIRNEPGTAQTGWLFLAPDETSALGRRHNDSLRLSSPLPRVTSWLHDAWMLDGLTPCEREAIALLDEAIARADGDFCKQPPMK